MRRPYLRLLSKFPKAMEPHGDMQREPVAAATQVETGHLLDALQPVVQGGPVYVHPGCSLPGVSRTIEVSFGSIQQDAATPVAK